MSLSVISPKTSAKNIIFSKIFAVTVLFPIRVMGCSFSSMDFRVSQKPKALHRNTEERLCSTEGGVAFGG
jgi:hypothetical protein